MFSARPESGHPKGTCIKWDTDISRGQQKQLEVEEHACAGACTHKRVFCETGLCPGSSCTCACASTQVKYLRDWQPPSRREANDADVASSC